MNDVRSRVGEAWIHLVLGRLDTPQNLLANKVTASWNGKGRRTWQTSGPCVA